MAEVANALSDRDEILRQLKFNLQKAQSSMVQQTNKHRRYREYNVSDMIFLKL